MPPSLPVEPAPASHRSASRSGGRPPFLLLHDPVFSVAAEWLCDTLSRHPHVYTSAGARWPPPHWWPTANATDPTAVPRLRGSCVAVDTSRPQREAARLAPLVSAIGGSVIVLGWHSHLLAAVHRLRVAASLPLPGFGGTRMRRSASDVVQAADYDVESMKRLQRLAMQLLSGDSSRLLSLQVESLSCSFNSSIARLLSFLGLGQPPIAFASLEALYLLDSWRLWLQRAIDSNALDASAASTAPAAASNRRGGPALLPKSLTSVLPMEHFHLMLRAVRPATNDGGAAGDASLMSTLDGRSLKSARRSALLHHVLRFWPLPARVLPDGRPLTAHFFALASPTLCAMLADATGLCAAVWDGPHGRGLGVQAELGCRCPFGSAAVPSLAEAAKAASTRASASAPSRPETPTAIFIGSHHKTGTVLAEQLMFELVRLAGSQLRKPSWRLCWPSNSTSSSPPPPPPRPPPPPMAASLGPAGPTHGDVTGDAHANAAAHAVPPVPLSLPKWPRAATLPDVCVDEHARSLPRAAPTGALFIHFVRDPLEVCVSSFQYALHAREQWLLAPLTELGGESLQQLYRRLPPDDGVVRECWRAIKEVRQMVLLYEASFRRADTLTLRLEEWNDNFDRTSRRLLAFLGLVAGSADEREPGRRADLAALLGRHDLRRHSPRAHEVAHASDPAVKERLRAALLRSRLSTELAELQARMHYFPRGVRRDHLVSRPGGLDGDPQYARWVTASLPRRPASTRVGE